MVEALNTSEKKLFLLNQEANLLKTTVEQLEKSKKQNEIDIATLNEKLNELTNINSSLTAKKRLIENEKAVIYAEIVETESTARSNDEKLKKALSDNTKLTEELKKEQVKEK
jgi:chromosome segregation ATPase